MVRPTPSHPLTEDERQAALETARQPGSALDQIVPDWSLMQGYGYILLDKHLYFGYMPKSCCAKRR